MNLDVVTRSDFEKLQKSLQLSSGNLNVVGFRMKFRLLTKSTEAHVNILASFHDTLSLSMTE